MAKTERRLEHLPGQGSPDVEYREWLTGATGCPSGLRFEDFIRHGADLKDACTFTVSAPGGDLMKFRTAQQRLSSPATIRAAIVYATHGLLRPEHLSRGEYEDIWVAMITLSNIVDSQVETDETWSWLTRYERECDRITGLSFTGDRRYDALCALLRRPKWGRVQASDREERPPGQRPAWIIDDENSDEYVRISELLAYLRYDVGVAPISASVLTARMHEIGGQRMYYEVRKNSAHPKATLYLLPAQAPADVPELEK